MAYADFITVGGALSIISGVVALVTSYISFQYSRLSKVSLLSYISFGFLLLGVGLIIQGWMNISLGLGFGNIYEDARLSYIAGAFYLLLQNVAYLTFAIGYTRVVYALPIEASIVVQPQMLRKYFLLGRLIFDTSQVLSIVLLSIIVFEAMLLETKSDNKISRLIMSSFLTLLASHIIMMYSSVTRTPFYYLVGLLVQFLSFALLAAFLLGWSRY